MKHKNKIIKLKIGASRTIFLENKRVVVTNQTESTAPIYIQKEEKRGV